MKFYEIKAGRIINLETIRTAHVWTDEILLTFTCGDTRSDRVVFGNAQEASDAFDALCVELGLKVKED